MRPLHQFCIPNRFPLSYLRNPNRNTPIATLPINIVNPAIAPNSGHVNWCNNCKGTNEMKPAGTIVKSSNRTTPVKMFIG